jgi:hypothetical protein
MHALAEQTKAPLQAVAAGMMHEPALQALWGT